MGASNEMIASRDLSHFSPVEQAATLDAKEANYRDNLGALEPDSGALALLDYADRRGIKRAVVTNAPRANAEKVLAALGVGARLPILVIGGSFRARNLIPCLAVPHGARPHQRFGRSFDRLRGICPSGVRAAAAVGLAVVGMTTTLDLPTSVEAGATFAAGNFTDPRIFELIETRLNAGAEERAKA